MPVLSLINRRLKSARIYFIPAGELVDAVTVTATTWPDNAPTTNYTAYEFADIETLDEEKEIETETFQIPKAGGGYKKDDEQQLVARRWKATSHKTNDVLLQLEHALLTRPVVGTAQAPGVNSDNFKLGVLLIEMQGKANAGAIIERTQVWAKLRLVTPGATGPATAKLEFTFEQQDSGNNTFIIPA